MKGAGEPAALRNNQCWLKSNGLRISCPSGPNVQEIATFTRSSFCDLPCAPTDAALAWDNFIEAGTAPVSARERAWLATSLAAIKSRQKEKDSGSDARVFTHDFLQMKAPRVSSVINLAEKGNVQHRCVAGVVSQVLSADLVRYFEFGWFTFNGKAMMSISTDLFGQATGVALHTSA